MQSLTNLSAVADRYDAFILDLWGVIHDGSHLYPGVHAALTQMRKADKKIIMLSNAPRHARKVEAVLKELGIETALYDRVLSSGEAGYQWLAAGKAPWGKRYYYIGPSKDADVVDGLDLKRVDDIKDADFLLNVGFGSEEQSAEDWAPLLRTARALKLPMLCLNPDLEVVKQTGERFPCAGVIGYAYQNAGGQVTWFGKPYPAVYENCMETFASIPKTKILAVGDSLETDIPGAINFGLDSLLITGGILNHHGPQEIAEQCHTLDLIPTYVMRSLVW